MMQFRSVKTQLTTILGNAAAGQFRVIGYQRETRDAEELLDNSRTVTVYYGRGQFQQASARGASGPMQHDMHFRIELAVSAEASLDLATIDDPNSTAAQKQTAMTAMLEAAEDADSKFDELAELVYQILMNPANYDVGLAKGEVANRFVEAIEKDQPSPRGELVTLTGSLNYSIRASEDLVSEVGTAMADVITNLEETADVTGAQMDTAVQAVEETYP